MTTAICTEFAGIKSLMADKVDMPMAAILEQAYSAIRLRLYYWRRKRARESGPHDIQTSLSWPCQRLRDLKERCGCSGRMSSTLTDTNGLRARRSRPRAQRTERCFSNARRGRDGATRRVLAYGCKDRRHFRWAAPGTREGCVRGDGQAARALSAA